MSRPAEQTDLAALAARVGQLLHAAGVGATPERCGRFAAALGLAQPATLDELYWLGRVTLLTDRDQIAVWDRVFAQVFRGMVDVAEARGQAGAAPRPGSPHEPRRGQAAGAGQPSADDHRAAHAPPMHPGGTAAAEDRQRETVMVAVSADERLRTRDFAAFGPDDLVRLRTLMRRLAVTPPARRSRRRVASRRGARVDLRATLRQARRSGGDPVRLQRRRHRRRPRRIVLLCDISGSMESYSRAYLELLLGAVGGARAEAFVFATRLTRLTRALRTVDPDLALERAGRAAPDWSGGTRIGDALKAFNDGYGRPGMARGAVVVVISDGWEQGDATLLGQEMGRLRRLAHRVIWVNPRSASARYRPLTAGMDAALPHVDVFLSGHSLDALEDVLDAVAGGCGHPSAARSAVHHSEWRRSSLT